MQIFADIGFFLLGAALTLFIVWYQERHPDVAVSCQSNTEGDPATITCRVINAGRGEARDVYVGFNHSYPLDTLVVASPEIGAEIVPSNNPPDPTVLPLASEHIQAFAVRLPRVPAKKSIEFQVQTANDDNGRAAKQILRLREEIHGLLASFGDRILEEHPEFSEDWDLARIMQARAKQENLFEPGNFSYEEGTFPIEYVDEGDKLALAVLDDLTRKYKAGYSDIFQTGREYKAPVIRIRTADGERTYATLPPFIKAYVEMRVSASQLKERKPIAVQPPIPESYD